MLPCYSSLQQQVKTAIRWLLQYMLGSDLTRMARFQQRMTMKFLSLEIRGCDTDKIQEFVEAGLETVRNGNGRAGVSNLCTMEVLEAAAEHYRFADVPGSP